MAVSLSYLMMLREVAGLPQPTPYTSYRGCSDEQDHGLYTLSYSRPTTRRQTPTSIQTDDEDLLSITSSTSTSTTLGSQWTNSSYTYSDPRWTSAASRIGFAIQSAAHPLHVADSREFICNHTSITTKIWSASQHLFSYQLLITII